MESANKKGDLIHLGDVTRFVNGNAGHSITWQEQGLSLASGVNASYNYASAINSFTWGPSLNMTKTLFKRLSEQTVEFLIIPVVVWGE